MTPWRNRRPHRHRRTERRQVQLSSAPSPPGRRHRGPLPSPHRRGPTDGISARESSGAYIAGSINLVAVSRAAIVVRTRSNAGMRTSNTHFDTCEDRYSPPLRSPLSGTFHTSEVRGGAIYFARLKAQTGQDAMTTRAGALLCLALTPVGGLCGELRACFRPMDDVTSASEGETLLCRAS